LSGQLLSESISSWLKLHLPSAGDPATILFHPCGRVPFWWLPGNRNVEALTLWRRVYVRRTRWPFNPAEPQSMELLFHELIHVEQFRRNPIRFPIRYLFAHLRYGYYDNPAEREARQRARQLTRLFFT